MHFPGAVVEERLADERCFAKQQEIENGGRGSYLPGIFSRCHVYFYFAFLPFYFSVLFICPPPPFLVFNFGLDIFFSLFPIPLGMQGDY